MDLGLKGKVALVFPGTTPVGAAIAARLASEGCSTTSDENAPRLDIVVCCAEGDAPGRIDGVPAERVLALLQAQLLGPWELIRRLAPRLREQGSGRIVFVIDAAAKVPHHDALAAAVCGAAQLAFVKALSDDLARDGVLVNAVCLSKVAGHPARALPQPRVGRSLDQQQRQWGLDVPLGRAGSPQDVASAVAFLASGRAAFIVGSNIDVDGGHQRSYI